ncbi:MAG: hypothetical protein C4308_11120 [Chitinophagaceae bacterium]
MKQKKKEYGRAWAFLGSGVALITTGIIIGKGDDSDKGDLFYETKEGWHYMLIGLGTVLSIPAFLNLLLPAKPSTKLT